MVAAGDIDKYANLIYAKNFSPQLMIDRNLWGLVDFQVGTKRGSSGFSWPPEVLDRKFAEYHGKVDILLGGPPCQGYSNANNVTRRNDPRNIMYLAMPAFAVALGARCLIIENVPAILNDPKGVVHTTVELLEDAGYTVDDQIVDCSKIGIPQTRKRHILIASRDGRPDIQSTLTAVACDQRSVGWAIGDLLDIESPSSFDTPSELSDENVARIEHVFENDLFDMPNLHRPVSHRNGHSYPSVYGRLSWDELAGTITTGFMTPGKGRFIHPKRRRALTPHEGARLQTFPDSFAFKADGSDQPGRNAIAGAVGEAVPPRLGFAAGLTALATLGKKI